MGSIKIILGCMFSGKTTEVIKECKRWESISKKVLCINYIGDDRFGKENNVSSHDLLKINCIKVEKLEDISIDIVANSDIIIINEGQFFIDIVPYCVTWCETYNKNIIVSGLDGTFERKPFGHLIELIPYADSVVKLNAYCSMCKDGTLAPFSFRITKEKKEILIGSAEHYTAVCRKHYIELLK